MAESTVVCPGCMATVAETDELVHLVVEHRMIYDALFKPGNIAGRTIPGRDLWTLDLAQRTGP